MCVSVSVVHVCECVCVCVCVCECVCVCVCECEYSSVVHVCVYITYRMYMNEKARQMHTQPVIFKEQNSKQ